jgi:hypothetical protein
MTYGATAELYQVNWKTSLLDITKNYRLEIWGQALSTAQANAARPLSPGLATLDQRWLFGWRDIQNSPNVSNCNGAEAFCQEKYGQTIPVKVRVEQFVFCPADRNCAVQFIASGSGANLQALLPTGSGAPSAQLSIPGQTGTDFALAFAPCTAAEDAALNAAVDIPTFGPCLKTVTTFSSSLVQAATVSICTTLVTSGWDLADPNTQLEQVTLHHFTSDLTQVKALAENHNCTNNPTSGGIVSAAPPKGLGGLALAVGKTLRSWITPRPLLAAGRRRRIDQGGGGDTRDVSSFFKLALPAKATYEAAGDASQSGLAGSVFTLKAKVTDVFGGPVKNARVHWSVVTPPNEGATVGDGSVSLGSDSTDASGIAQNTVTLSPSQGYNVFNASGRGIADSRTSGCIIPPSTPASCNGPRDGPPYGPFDPFIPLHTGPAWPESGVVPATVPIAERTFLPFTVYGCTPGYGTATIDGIFGASEWACANSQAFTANVSGGATPATLYWMNDGTNLYLAVRILRSTKDKVNTLQFNFDNDDSWTLSGSGAAAAGDDVLSLDGLTGFVDAYLTLKCAGSSQSSCWSSDVSAGGVQNGSGKVANNGTYTTYEISHALKSLDGYDFSLTAGSKVGLFLTLQTGSGAAGNTQWPGFRKYLEITIK